MSTSFPNLSRKVYARLYHSFHKTVPTTITLSYLQAQLEASKSSAGVYINDLKKIGFLDDDGNTTSLVHRWKMPESYSQACQEILQNVYPDELLQLAGNDPDFNIVKNWFKAEGMNDSIAGQRAGFFCLLNENVPPEKQEAQTKKKITKIKSKAESTKFDAVNDPAEIETATASTTNLESKKEENGLNISHDVNVNIQIHIGADASSEQIEAIFSNMAKYLK